MKIKPFFAIIFILVAQLNIKLNAQTSNYWEKSWTNTFSNEYLNHWLLTNEGDINDTISMIEGCAGKLKYSEIEDQCKYITTKKNIIIVDDADKVIYQLASNYQNTNKKTIDFSEIKLDSNQIISDTVVSGEKYILHAKSEDMEFEVQINMKTLLIEWIKEYEEIQIYNEVTRRDETKLIIKIFSLTSHETNKTIVMSYLNPTEYFKETDDGYMGIGKYKNYEILNIEK